MSRIYVSMCDVFIHKCLRCHGTSLEAQCSKNLPAMQETTCNAGDAVQCLGGEDPLEKKMATPSSSLGWEITWTEEPGRSQSLGSPRVRCK